MPILLHIAPEEPRCMAVILLCIYCRFYNNINYICDECQLQYSDQRYHIYTELCKIIDRVNLSNDSERAVQYCTFRSSDISTYFENLSNCF